MNAASDRGKMQRVVDRFGEAGTVDEMGLRTLREALSDGLFPGVSSIQTRRRMVGARSERNGKAPGARGWGRMRPA